MLDNPVRKDRVFGLPYMSAASWKGMLCWACRMQARLREHLAQGKRFDDWTDPAWILHLFGSEYGDRNDFKHGALVFHPTWFDKIDFEVINPHDRSHRTGRQPIYYEVVPGRRPRPAGQDG
ncbi:MAG: RAMP superfamily CRISPR-associated protein [Candidatus Binatia bacterium]|nr:RAMP superfamily CRISPR-associated protein [Candidatus Binatia bacterium]